jgi:hypothetical protein
MRVLRQNRPSACLLTSHTFLSGPAGAAIVGPRCYFTEIRRGCAFGCFGITGGLGLTFTLRDLALLNFVPP